MQLAGVGDQVGRIACAFIGMRMCINGQREIFERDITGVCIDTTLLQRQRVGIAAGNGQLLVLKAKTFLQFDVPQQINLGAIRCIADRFGQRCIGFAIDRTHILIAACAGRRVRWVLVEIGDGVVVCIRVGNSGVRGNAVCGRPVCSRSTLHRVRLSRAGSSMGGGGHNHRGLFL